jgi:hypothetical protein
MKWWAGECERRCTYDRNVKIRYEINPDYTADVVLWRLSLGETIVAEGSRQPCARISPRQECPMVATTRSIP